MDTLGALTCISSLKKISINDMEKWDEGQGHEPAPLGIGRTPRAPSCLLSRTFGAVQVSGVDS